MEEKNITMTDEQLAQELCKSKGGKLGGKLLSLLGGAVAIAGILLGGNIVLIVILVTVFWDPIFTTFVVLAFVAGTSAAAMS